jgi:short-subunit dehydrogenase
MSRFTGKNVVITGASLGIGAAAARQFAGEGARLALVARSPGPLEKVAAELRGRGTHVVTIAADVGKNEDCRRIVDTAAAELGGIDVLVNNAGANKRGAVEKYAAEDLAAVVDVNLRAPIYLTCLALPHLRKNAGAVVGVASLAGFTPLPDSPVYSATKFGLRAFSHALAEQLADSGVRISVVSPGPVDTSFIMEEIDEVPDIIFSQPVSTADEVAQAILDCAAGTDREIALPAVSGKLATLGYLVPSLQKALRPLLEWRGRKVKDRYRK